MEAEDNYMNSNEFGKFFGEGGGSKALLKFKGILTCEGVESIEVYALKIMEFLQLVKSDKGQVSTYSKYKSLYFPWLRYKTKNYSSNGINN